MDGSPTIRTRRAEFLRTVGIALVLTVAVVAAFYVLRPKAPAPPPAAKPTAADLAAPASLKAAAAASGWKPNTEPGVGSVENKPASDEGSPSNDALLPVGTQAPQFTLKTPQGESVSLSSMRGKAVLLEFFASWCPHCVAEAPHLAALARSFAGQPVAFASINADSEDAGSVYAYHRYFGLPFPALVDPGQHAGSYSHPGSVGKVSAAYKIADFPTFYVLDKNGIVRWRNDREQPDAAIKQAIQRALGE